MRPAVGSRLRICLEGEPIPPAHRARSARKFFNIGASKKVMSSLHSPVHQTLTITQGGRCELKQTTVLLNRTGRRTAHQL